MAKKIPLDERSANIQKLGRLVSNLPPEGLSAMLAHVVRACIQQKTFGNRSVASIVATLEKQVKGEKANAPNQSPMPKRRQADLGIASQVASELKSKQ